MMQPYLLPLVYALRTERDCRRTRGLKSAFLTGAFSANQRKQPISQGLSDAKTKQLQREGRPVPVNAWQATGVREVLLASTTSAASPMGDEEISNHAHQLIDAATLKASRSRAAPTAARRR